MCGAENVQALDTISGIRNWEETAKNISSGWKKNELPVSAAGWKFDREQEVWRGPGDNSNARVLPRNKGKQKTKIRRAVRKEHYIEWSCTLRVSPSRKARAISACRITILSLFKPEHEHFWRGRAITMTRPFDSSSGCDPHILPAPLLQQHQLVCLHEASRMEPAEVHPACKC